MTAKRSITHSDEPEPSAPQCYVPREELDAAKANTIDFASAKVIVRPIAVASGLITAGGFLIYCTLSVSAFMHETRSFQASATIALKDNGASIKQISQQLAIVTTKQNNVIGDRWRFTDMQPWAYQLEKANRDLLREGGAKGLVVPDPIAKDNDK